MKFCGVCGLPVETEQMPSPAQQYPANLNNQIPVPQYYQGYQMPVSASVSPGYYGEAGVRIGSLVLSKKALWIIAGAAAAIILIAVVLIVVLTGKKAESLTDLAEIYVEAFNSGDTDEIIECYQPDYIEYALDEEFADSEREFLEIQDEFYETFYRCEIEDYEIGEKEYFDDADEIVEGFDEFGVDVERVGRVTINADTDDGDVQIFLFAVETEEGWYAYKANVWY